MLADYFVLLAPHNDFFLAIFVLYYILVQIRRPQWSRVLLPMLADRFARIAKTIARLIFQVTQINIKLVLKAIVYIVYDKYSCGNLV